MNKKRKLTGKLLFVVLVIMATAVFMFAGCSIEIEETTTETPSGTTPAASKYTGPIKNVAEMVEYKGKTVYDRLKISSIPDQEIILNASEDGKTITNISILKVVTPTATSNSYTLYDYSNNCSIPYDQFLMESYTSVISTSSIGRMSISKEKFDLLKKYGNPIATKAGLDPKDIQFYLVKESVEKTFTAEDRPEGVTFDKYKIVRATFYTNKGFFVYDVKVKSDNNDDLEKLMTNFNANNYTDLVKNTRLTKENFGPYILTKDSVDKEYPAA